MATNEDLLAALMNEQPAPTGNIYREAPTQDRTERPSSTARRQERARPSRRAHRLDYDALADRAAGIAGLLVWVGLWLVDGYFTATFISNVFAVSILVGAAAHVVVSLVQQRLWRRGWRDNWMIIVPIATLNISTTVIGIWQWLASRTTARPFQIFDALDTVVPVSQVWFWLAVVFGIGIAILPERKAAKHAVELLD